MKTSSKLKQVLEKLGGEKVIRYDLERFRKALREVGNPHKNVYSLIIGGTNGKGTTSLLISNTLAEAGYRTATYLSPHLVNVEERFLLNGVAISELELELLAQDYSEVAVRNSLSYFEYLTLLFFLWANHQKAHFMVLEVGLGGRLDATNVTDPIASVITNIGLDHTEYLGNTLEEILEEKMGILREECLLFSGITEPALLHPLEKRLAELDGIYYYSKEIRRTRTEVSWHGQKVLFNGHPFTLSCPTPGMLENAALAFLLLRVVFPKIPLAVLQKSFEKTKNPGRFEIIQENPRVILSGDHNLPGMLTLLSTLKELAPENLKILCGFSGDKPYRALYGLLKELNPTEMLLTEITRARVPTPIDYSALGPFEPNLQRGYDHLIENLKPHETLLVTGSLYLVGEIKRKIGQNPI